MQVLINQQSYELPEPASLSDAIALLQPKPPFAAAVNLAHVPRSHYAQTMLKSQDQIEIITPVTGG
jgi:sulfur carrier protein